jgi:hypothetical protein
MKPRFFAALLAAAGLCAFVQPASACSNGYEAVWIQGNKVCKLKTPKLSLKAKQTPEPAGARELKSR